MFWKPTRQPPWSQLASSVLRPISCPAVAKMGPLLPLQAGPCPPVLRRPPRPGVPWAPPPPSQPRALLRHPPRPALGCRPVLRLPGRLVPQTWWSPSHSGHMVTEPPPLAGTDDGFGQPGQRVGRTAALTAGQSTHRGGTWGQRACSHSWKGAPSQASISQTEPARGVGRQPWSFPWVPGSRAVWGDRPVAAGPAPGTGPHLAPSARPSSIRQSARPCAHCPAGRMRVGEASMGLLALSPPVTQRPRGLSRGLSKAIPGSSVNVESNAQVHTRTCAGA